MSEKGACGGSSWNATLKLVKGASMEALALCQDVHPGDVQFSEYSRTLALDERRVKYCVLLPPP